MEKQTKNLGHATAYGYAKSQGYTGTEEEYAELMASYATVAERAETAAESAEESAQEVKDVIPEVTAQDNGKVMMVENGEWGAGEVDVLPTVTSQDNGKVLGVVEGQWTKTEPEDGLPEVTSSDNGKVLSVVEGAWAPAEPTGGSGLPEVTSEDNGDLLSVVDGAWAKSEPGYRVSEVDVVPEQTVEATDQGGFFEAELTNTALPFPPPETLSVTVNGTVYDLPSTSVGVSEYGAPWGDDAPDFTTYPLSISFDAGYCNIITPDAGPYTVHSTIATAKTSKNFVSAVEASYFQVVDGEKEFISNQTVTTTAVPGRPYSSGNISKGDGTITEVLPPTLTVTFDGVEYELPKVPLLQGYGARSDDSYDFTNYPLFIFEGYTGTVYQWQLYTPNAGTHTLSATYTEATTVPTEKFKEAVKQSGGGALIVNDDGGSLDKTWQEIFDAYISGTAVVIRTETHSGDSTQGNTEVIYSVAESVSTNTVVDQGEEIVAYYVMASENRYEASSANEYPYANSGGGGQ